MKMPNIVQIVLGSGNLPFCKHLYATVSGFAGAGDRLVCSEHDAQVMGFGARGGAIVLYMMGRQELLQLEFWTHTTPPQRPVSAKWRPNDIGFCRFGVSVSDFPGTLKRLSGLELHTLTPAVEVAGLRRVCFRDPTIGIPVEIMEEGASLPGSRGRYHDLDPAVVYVAASVKNLEDALAYFGGVVGLSPWKASCTRQATRRSGACPTPAGGRPCCAGARPSWSWSSTSSRQGRARPLDDGLDRQGFKIVAVGFRDPSDTGAIFRRVNEAGLRWTVAEPLSHIGGNHVVGAVAHHMKILSVPPELERQFGFSPEPQKWRHPPARDPGAQLDNK